MPGGEAIGAGTDGRGIAGPPTEAIDFDLAFHAGCSGFTSDVRFDFEIGIKRHVLSPSEMCLR